MRESVVVDADEDDTDDGLLCACFVLLPMTTRDERRGPLLLSIAVGIVCRISLHAIRNLRRLVASIARPCGSTLFYSNTAFGDNDLCLLFAIDSAGASGGGEERATHVNCRRTAG